MKFNTINDLENYYTNYVTTYYDYEREEAAECFSYIKEFIGSDYKKLLEKASLINADMKKCIREAGLTWNAKEECYYNSFYYKGLNCDDVVFPAYQNSSYRINYGSHSDKEQCIEIALPHNSSIMYSFRSLGIDDCIADFYEKYDKDTDGDANKYSFCMEVDPNTWKTKFW